MIGIVSHAAYLPAYRISREEIATAWGGRAQAGRKVVMRFDEDPLTMAATAAWQCVASEREQQKRASLALYFASSTAPYQERLNASIIAALCDLDESAFVADFAASLRAGTTALMAAADRVAAGGGNVIVVAADAREAEPGSNEELTFSDAAAAIALGSEHVIAELIARVSRYDDFFETARRDRDDYVSSFEGKFSVDRGYLRSLRWAIQRVLEQAGVTAENITKLVVPAFDKRAHVTLAEKLEFADRVQDVTWDELGNTGCAAPLLLLSAALEKASPGDLIVCAGYGNGADAFLFRVTEQIAGFKVRVGMEALRRDPISYKNYTLYRKGREYRHTHEDNLEITNIFYNKDESQTIRVHGSECQACGTRHFPTVRVCAKCEKSDTLKEVAMQRTGQVFTFAVDHLAASPFPPTVMAVVDLDGGGRIYCEVADTEPDKVQIGTPVELIPRRLREGGGLYHYYWKCRPRRDV
jgi:3-hydroxy-3-methylglutaryl CoA synthase